MLKDELQGDCGKAVVKAKDPLVSLLPQFPFCCMAAPLLQVKASWESPVPCPSPSPPPPSAPYLADTRGTLVTTPTEHSPIRVPAAVEIASHCRGERKKQLKVFGQLKKRGEQTGRGVFGKKMRPRNTPQHAHTQEANGCSPTNPQPLS